MPDITKTLAPELQHIEESWRVSLTEDYIKKLVVEHLENLHKDKKVVGNVFLPHQFKNSYEKYEVKGQVNMKKKDF